MAKTTLENILAEKFTKSATKIDINVGLGNLINFVCSANANVGQVTVAHGLGTETVIRVQRLSQLKSILDEDAWSDYCKKELKVLSYAWGQAFKGESYNFKLYGNKFETERIINKVTEDQKIDNVLVHTMCAEQIADYCQAVKFMNKTNLENLSEAAKIFMEIGRFFQELTIDAAKTGMTVHIPYFKNIQLVHLASRQRSAELFNVKICWNGEQEKNELIEKRNKRKDSANEVNGFESWKRRYINYSYGIPNCGFVAHKGGDCLVEEDGKPIKYILTDECHKMRFDMIGKIAKSASKLGGHEQTISPEFKAFVAEKTKGCEKYFATMKIANNMYKSVSTAKQQLLSQIKEDYKDLDADILEEKLKFAKKYFDPAFETISNNVRKATANLEPEVRAAVAFQVILNEKSDSIRNGRDTDENKLSAFVQDILKEETILFMAEVKKSLYGEEIPTVEIKILNSTFEDGEIAYFENGFGINNGIPGACAVALEKINGKFTVRKNEQGNFYVKANLKNIVSERIPESKTDSICFMTKSTAECSLAVDLAMKKLSKGKEVILAGYHKTNGVKDLSDSVIVDSEEIIRYVNSDGYDRVGNNEYGKAINFKVGKVAFCSRYVKTIPQGSPNAGDYNVIVCVLEDVKDLVGKQNSERLKNVKPLKIEIKKADKKETATKKKFKPSFLKDDSKNQIEEPKIIEKSQPAKKQYIGDDILQDLEIEILNLDSVLQDMEIEALKLAV